MNQSPVIIALDFDDMAQAMTLVEQVDPKLCRLKVGKEMFTRFGRDFVRRLVALGFDVFLDLKFHDIPNTVAKACLAAADLGVWMINVHASGGRKMMQAAKEAIHSYTHTHLIAVTVLTSMEESDLADIGWQGSARENVLRLAKLSQQAGVDGVVCSALEATDLRQALGEDFLLVTPGIRPNIDSNDDQKRVMTPNQALRAGANYLVIGRPITRATSPMDSLQKILIDIEKVSMR